MMGLGNPMHLAFLGVVLLLLFGAKRLPEMGRSLGHGLAGFKDAISGADPAPELPAALSQATARQPEGDAVPVAEHASAA